MTKNEFRHEMSALATIEMFMTTGERRKKLGKLITNYFKRTHRLLDIASIHLPEEFDVSRIPEIDRD